MNRILRRPMFRMGGTPNEGIMTGLTNPRMGYSTGSGPGLEDIIARKKTEQETLFTEPYIQSEYAKFLESPLATETVATVNVNNAASGQGTSAGTTTGSGGYYIG